MFVPNSPDQVDNNTNNIIEKEVLSQTCLQIAPLTLTNSRKDIEIHTNAYLDTSSDRPLIRRDITEKLNLTEIKRTINISDAVANTRKTLSEVVNFIITPQTNKCDCSNIDHPHVMNKANIPNNKIDEVVINKYELYMIFLFQN